MSYEINESLLRELREQASTLLTGAHLLEPLVTEQGRDNDRAYLAAMNKSLYCLLRTIGHLELTEQESLSFRPVPLDLARLCRELGEQVESLTRNLGVTFRWNTEGKAILALGDQALLTQAILILLTNAFESAGAGGHVTLNYSPHGARCLVTVTDDGPGLAESDPAASPLLKRPGGLGLGLPTARRCAEAHGGSVVLENGERGVRAVLSIPIQEPEGGMVKSPARDSFGGFSPLLVEFAPLLPAETFFGRNLD